MGADDARLIERSVWDASGMERIPFDGRTTARPDSRITSGYSTAQHGPQCSGNPEIGCQCDYDGGEYLPAGEITPGMRVEIYGGTEVEVLRVNPYKRTDSFDPSSPWVSIQYRWSGAQVGRRSLPASQRLRVVEW